MVPGWVERDFLAADARRNDIFRAVAAEQHASLGSSDFASAWRGQALLAGVVAAARRAFQPRLREAPTPNAPATASAVLAKS